MVAGAGLVVQGEQPRAGVQEVPDRGLLLRDHGGEGGQPYSRRVVWDAYRRPVALARERGAPVTAEESGHRPTDPLPELVAAAQALKRRMDLRAGAVRPAGAAGTAPGLASANAMLRLFQVLVLPLVY